MATAGRRRVSVEVTGDDQIRRAFRVAAERAGDTTDADRAAGEAVAERAAALAPHRSGRLSRSVRVEPADGGGVLVAAGSTEVPYAGVIQYGWPARGIDAQPFLTDALADAAGDIERAYDDHAGRVVREWDVAAP